jgi:hypothetical protein
MPAGGAASQRRPKKVPAHWQVKVFAPSVQVPPCWQGFGLQPVFANASPSAPESLEPPLAVVLASNAPIAPPLFALAPPLALPPPFALPLLPAVPPRATLPPPPSLPPAALEPPLPIAAPPTEVSP